MGTLRRAAPPAGARLSARPKRETPASLAGAPGGQRTGSGWRSSRWIGACGAPGRQSRARRPVPPTAPAPRRLLGACFAKPANPELAALVGHSFLRGGQGSRRENEALEQTPYQKQRDHRDAESAAKAAQTQATKETVRLHRWRLSGCHAYAGSVPTQFEKTDWLRGEKPRAVTAKNSAAAEPGGCILWGSGTGSFCCGCGSLNRALLQAAPYAAYFGRGSDGAHQEGSK